MSTPIAHGITASTAEAKHPKKRPVKKREVEKVRAAAASTYKIKAKEGEPEEDEDNKSVVPSEDEDPADEEESELEEDAAAASKRYFWIPERKRPSLLTKLPSAQARHCRRSKRLILKGVGKLVTSTSSFALLEVLLSRW